MAKRFIDTEIFNDEWFMDLSKDGKLLYIYLFTGCNHAGVIKLNFKLAKFKTGINSIETVLKQLGNRCLRVKEEYYFLPKFIKYQYPNFPKSSVKQQESALRILEELNIDYNSCLSLKVDLVESYDNDSDNVNDTIKQIYNKYYDSEIENNRDKDHIKEYIILVKFLFGQNKDEIQFPNLLKLRDQFSYVNFKNRFGKYKIPQFAEGFKQMENWDGIKKKKSIALTFDTFARKW